MPAECVSSHGRLREDIHPVVVMASGEVEIAATISQVCRKARRTVLRLSPVFEQNVIPTARMGREHRSCGNPGYRPKPCLGCRLRDWSNRSHNSGLTGGVL